jgi:hypothetical protein
MNIIPTTKSAAFHPVLRLTNAHRLKPLIFSDGHFFHPVRNSFDASKSPPYNAAVSTINEFIPRNTTDTLRGPARGYFNLGNGTSILAQLQQI